MTPDAPITYDRQQTAERAGIALEKLDRLVSLGVIQPSAGDRFSSGDARKAGLATSLTEAGIPLEGMAELMRRGTLSFDFMDDPAYERFAAMSGTTFRQLAEQTGIPVEVLLLVREAIGLAQATPDDYMREDEVRMAPAVDALIQIGHRPASIEQTLRVWADGLRRITETEAARWRDDVIAPRLAAGMSMTEIGAIPEIRVQVEAGEQAMIEAYRAHQAHAWTKNIIEGFEYALTQAGLVASLDRPPAMCFLDITGYTRLTQERGDEAAAALATEVARLVQRTSVQHTGKPVKWLGDGVMFWFREPGLGVLAALEMVAGVAGAGLPPAHVGLHAGPVIFQQGDYYGQTVNLASRIAEYARPGEVLVSQAVVDAAAGDGGDAAFRDIGEVELKGVAGTVHLHSAHRSVAP